MFESYHAYDMFFGASVMISKGDRVPSFERLTIQEPEFAKRDLDSFTNGVYTRILPSTRSLKRMADIDSLNLAAK